MLPTELALSQYVHNNISIRVRKVRTVSFGTIDLMIIKCMTLYMYSYRHQYTYIIICFDLVTKKACSFRLDFKFVDMIKLKVEKTTIHVYSYLVYQMIL